MKEELTDYQKKIITHLKMKNLNDFHDIVHLITYAKSTENNKICGVFDRFPWDKRVRMFCLFRLVAKVKRYEKIRRDDYPLREGLLWLDVEHLVPMIKHLKMEMDFINNTDDELTLDETAELIYKQLEESEDWEEWKPFIENLDLEGIDEEIEEIRLIAVKEESVKEICREIEKNEGKARVIDIIVAALKRKGKFKDVVEGQNVNMNRLAQQIASEDFGDIKKTGSIRLRLMNLRDRKENVEYEIEEAKILKEL